MVSLSRAQSSEVVVEKSGIITRKPIGHGRFSAANYERPIGKTEPIRQGHKRSNSPPPSQKKRHVPNSMVAAYAKRRVRRRRRIKKRRRRRRRRREESTYPTKGEFVNNAEPPFVHRRCKCAEVNERPNRPLSGEPFRD